MSGVLKAKVGGVWVPIMGSGMTAEVARWNSAWGQIASANLYNGISALTTTQATIATLASVPTVAGRRYKVTAGWRTLEQTSGAGQVHGFRFMCTGIPGETGAADHYMLAGDAANYGGGPSIVWRFVGTGSPVTLTFTGATVSGTGNFHSDTGSGCGFWIEDVGPAIYNPAPPPVNTPTPWMGVTFQNGWSDYASGFQTCQYRSIGDIVYIRGLMKGGTIGAQVAFVLPTGLRPPGRLQIATQAAGAFAWFSINNSDGGFYPELGNNAAYNINCSFSTTA